VTHQLRHHHIRPLEDSKAIERPLSLTRQMFACIIWSNEDEEAFRLFIV